MNHYELEPWHSSSVAYHDHKLQREVIHVISGTATFETGDGAVTVGPREARKEFQCGRNRGDERVVTLAFGAPLEYGGGTMRRSCATCGERTDHSIERAKDWEALSGYCEECGAETGQWERGSIGGVVP